MLKKDIRKTLIETKENKEKLLIEQNIIKNRMMMIFENQENIDNFRELPKSKRVKIASSFITEIQTLDELGLINEGFLDILKSLFGRAFGSVAETAAEPLVNGILSAIGFKSNGFMKKFMISFITTRPTELLKALTDCKAMTKLLVESFIEALVMMLQQETEKGGYFYDFIRNQLGGMIKETSMVSSLENKFAGTVCSMFDKFTGKAQDVANKLKTTTPDENGVAMSAAKTPVQSTEKETGFMDSIQNLFTK
jgi:hypothetical protein